ncbi:MAG: SDR family oxidoreductase [Alphaproteobacteria bacterium]|nr:SDR family oxidoreductase [Alphaproteobacteria bacterium]
MARAASSRLFCFGLGYSARALCRALAGDGFGLAGTTRSGRDEAASTDPEIDVFAFDGNAPLAPEALRGTTHLLVSIPPDGGGDIVLRHHRDDLASALAGDPPLRWIGYLSTTGVYGDRGGAWVDEASALAPSSDRSRRRAVAERQWLDAWRETGLPVHVFRLAGIYGPGHSALDQLRAGTAKRIIAPGHLFSRIHVADIVAVLRASMAAPNPGAVYNVCDDEPAEPAAVIEFAAGLLGLPPPPAERLADATLSEMAKSFWADDRRVRNARIKDELGVRLLYPDYRAGLTAIAAAEGLIAPPLGPSR